MNTQGVTIRHILFFSIVCYYCFVQLLPLEQQMKTVFHTENKPLVIAHRGGAGIAPENTLYAFQLAEHMGVDAIELDVRMTKDKELVVIHDETIDRTTNGNGNVRDFTLAELKKFDAGFHKKTNKGKYPFRNKNITIPSLEEVFQTVRDTPLIIELKDQTFNIENKVASLINKYNMEQKVIIGSFNDDSLEKFATYTKRQVPIGAGITSVEKFIFLKLFNLDRLYSMDRHAIQLPNKIGAIDLASKGIIQAVHERNIAVHYWTINDKRTMQKLINLNVDGIITDYPNKLMLLLNHSDQKADN